MDRRVIAGSIFTAVSVVALGQVFSIFDLLPAIAKIEPLDPAFEALSACDKLRQVERDGKSLLDYVVASGVEEFADEVRSSCPDYEPVIVAAETGVMEFSSIGSDRDDIALNFDGFIDPAFEQFGSCAKLQQIEADGKSVWDYVVASGAEEFSLTEVDANCPEYGPFLRGEVEIILNPDFEEESVCDRLRTIQGDGKSVSDYIAASGVDEFITPIQNTCPEFDQELAWALSL